MYASENQTLEIDIPPAVDAAQPMRVLVDWLRQQRRDVGASVSYGPAGWAVLVWLNPRFHPYPSAPDMVRSLDEAQRWLDRQPPVPILAEQLSLF